jgi:hypothetical protein
MLAKNTRFHVKTHSVVYLLAGQHYGSVIRSSNSIGHGIKNEYNVPSVKKIFRERRISWKSQEKG